MCNCKNKIGVQQMISTVGSSLPYLKFAYCAYKDQFEKVFRDVGITINNESQLPAFASLYDSGGDLRGDVNGPNGPIKFSIEKQMSLIDVAKPVNNSCAI